MNKLTIAGGFNSDRLQRMQKTRENSLSLQASLLAPRESFQIAGCELRSIAPQQCPVLELDQSDPVCLLATEGAQDVVDVPAGQLKYSIKRSIAEKIAIRLFCFLLFI